MIKFWEFIVKHRKAILAITLLLVALSVFFTITLVDSGKINSDLLTYLPEGTQTYEGMEFIIEEFGIKGDGLFVVSAGEPGSEDYTAFSEEVKQVSQMEGVSNVVWYGTLGELDTLKDNPLFADFADKIDTTSVEEFLCRPQEEKPGYNNYVVLIFMDYSASTPEAFDLLDDIEARFAHRDSALDGMTYSARTILRETLGEAPLYILIGVGIVLIILLITTTSFIEPLILLITLGVSIIINMGTNYFLPEISILTFASCSILQLGVAMDYAIFFMHRYREERDSGKSPEKSAAVSGKSVFVTVLASSLTTIAGFGALIFMQFSIGLDIGRVIMKGVALSLLTVVILQPCLSVMMDRLLDKTSHKALRIPFDKPAGLLIKARNIILIVCVLLIVPSFIGQSRLNYSYFKIFAEPENPTSQQVLAAELRNQMIVAVPVIPKEGKTHAEFLAELKEDENITNVMGLFEIADIPHEALTPTNVKLIKALSPYASSMFTVRKVDGVEKAYTLYTLTIESEAESETSYETLNHITTVVDKYFDESYPMGTLTGINDMRELTPRDFLSITIISVVSILLIMGLMLKSFRKAFLTVLVIELAIWVNFSISYLMGETVNFMVYIIIGSIQLGCTVDYAILTINNFDEDMRRLKDSRLAAKSAISRSFNPVMTSAAIIGGACLGVLLVSKNLVVREITFLLTRGAFISFAAVVLVMPGLLVFFKKILPLKEEIERLKRDVLLSRKEFREAQRKRAGR
ncbi:MAG: efflux RND transporter permease subunit [Christensenellales bacterium]|jgi:predicted RND superfamily exporter protein